MVAKKILLIEDDPFLVDIYSSKIKKAGFLIEIAEDGEKGLQRAKEGKPDLVLLDIVLPKMDGWEVLEKIRQDENLKDLKVVVLSNLGQKEEVEKGIALKATKYLIKAHYAPSDVIKEIEELLK